MINATLLHTYTQAFTRLNRGQTPYGLAPHKPVLLLSIIELVENGTFVDNQIYLNQALLNAFKENWQLLVTTSNTEDITQPFYYLQNDRAGNQAFWFLQAKPNHLLHKPIKSLKQLQESCAYAYMSTDLWQLVLNPISRETLRQLLIQSYFPEQAMFFNAAKQLGTVFLQNQTQSILNDPAPKYGQQRVHTIEEGLVRNGLFQRHVTALYQYQCSFTGMKLQNAFNYHFVDACHIIPFSISFNDSLSNGIALCPNMHRAFDHGLLSIDEDYRILVSEYISEDHNHPYALASLKGRKILLPKEQRHYPAKEALEWHRTEIFKR